MSESPPPSRSRRTQSWWEPIFSAGQAWSPEPGDWALPDEAALRKLLTAQALKGALTNGSGRTRFKDVRFKDCDLFGRFDQIERALIFDGCQFVGCDFGLTTWDRAKFKNCEFKRCSFSQSTWIRSEFRDCTWSEIGLSGNETVLDRVFISNPEEFIRSAYTNLDKDELHKRHVSAHFQRTRLEETKATVARNLYNSHRIIGDDETFYKACKAYLTQACISRQQDRLFTFNNKDETDYQRLKAGIGLAGADLEFGLVWVFGNLNSWGGSISKPLSGLVGVYALFSILYAWVCGFDGGDALGKAFDITAIAGFTRAVAASDAGIFLYLAWLNLALSILFYTVLFSTAVSKISRTR